jgi:SAM-dependent methyltransferase
LPYSVNPAGFVRKTRPQIALASFVMQQLYLLLERKTPTWLKALIPRSWRIWLGYQIKVRWGSRLRPKSDAPSGALLSYLHHELVLPPGETESSLWNYLNDFRQEHGPKEELDGYLHNAFRRFLYTLQIVPPGNGRLLEVGAGPYFATLLLRRFRQYEMELINYFGPAFGEKSTQAVVSSNERVEFEFYNVNVEEETIPVAAGRYDVVLLCEVLEHFTNDPVKALRELKRVLKSGGTLILTTPNVNRLENVARMISGHNIYDPFSGYGPYGRHNREYNREELDRLLDYLGFDIELCFTSDVHDNMTHFYADPNTLAPLVEHRKHDLGQYFFIRARNNRPGKTKKPDWLYRSYAPDELGD